MERKERFSLKKRRYSFCYAFSGLYRFFKTEHNAWIHAVATVLVIVMGLIFHISTLEWLIILILIGMVLSAEAFNTCIEKMMDRMLPGQDKTVKYVKDLAAGAVLITAIIAAIAGLIIFLPKIVALF